MSWTPWVGRSLSPHQKGQRTRRWVLCSLLPLGRARAPPNEAMNGINQSGMTVGQRRGRRGDLDSRPHSDTVIDNSPVGTHNLVVATLLVIDDDRLILDCFRFLFPDGTVKLHTATSAREGRSQYEALRPDAVLLDVQLPD